jgi:hypothetical protein
MIENGGVPLWEKGIALLLLLLLSPLLLVLLTWVKVVSPGPALFFSKRIGKGGEIFRLFKLRTMVPDAPQVVSIDLRTVVPKNDGRLIGSLDPAERVRELFQLVICTGRCGSSVPAGFGVDEWYLSRSFPLSVPRHHRLGADPRSRNFSTREGYHWTCGVATEHSGWIY